MSSKSLYLIIKIDLNPKWTAKTNLVLRQINGIHDDGKAITFSIQ